MVLTISGVASRDRNTVEPSQAAFPIDPTSPAGVQPVGRSGYTLTFSDEFNGSSLDRAKWDIAYPDWPRFNSQVPGGRFTNTGNANCYDAAHISVAGGSCMLTAEKVQTISGLPYTSGMLSSLPSYAPKYGYAEVRMRLPSMPKGLWPAAWMSCSNFDQWPPEIDFMEAGLTGGGINLNNVYLSGDSYKGSVSGVDFSAWHTFGCAWTASAVTFYLDGSQTNTTPKTPNTQQYLILDLAVDNAQGATFTSATMEIDYVRYWQ